jgi:hypothetical protein
MKGKNIDLSQEDIGCVVEMVRKEIDEMLLPNELADNPG